MFLESPTSNLLPDTKQSRRKRTLVPCPSLSCTGLAIAPRHHSSRKRSLSAVQTTCPSSKGNQDESGVWTLVLHRGPTPFCGDRGKQRCLAEAFRFFCDALLLFPFVLGFSEERTPCEESSGFSSDHFRSRVENCRRSTPREGSFEKLQNKLILKCCGQHSNEMVVECRTTATETSIE